MNFKDYPSITTFTPSLTNPFTILGFWGRYRNTGLFPGVTAGVTMGEGKAAAVSSVDIIGEMKFDDAAVLLFLFPRCSWSPKKKLK